MTITQEQLKNKLSYNRHTGEFTWLYNSGGRSLTGSVAGCKTVDGYRRIEINDKEYPAHKLAFLYMTGSMPKICDHINRDRDDNRWENLRQATAAENSRNIGIRKDNTSGYPGVSYNKQRGKYTAYIRVDGVLKHLGAFACKHHAFCEYVKAARKYFGEFSPV